ncbi:MAG: dienelactone hydrolase family protein [Candidatus Marinimicrobia bacterium]|nr:dienelactone hydrolase family protein [Candidatus Neomarinimicrobiota bacterium]
MVFPVIAPFADLPEPTGSYYVATRTVTWTDSSREETFTKEQDYRRIVVQVWYPTKETNRGVPNLYIDDPVHRLPAIAKQLRLPVVLFKHFDRVKTHSDTAVHINEFQTVFPVVLFSHGLSGMRFQNTSLMEELASQGYVVFAADHSYEANITIFENGETAEYRAGKRRVLKGDRLENIDLSQLSIIVEDLSFILDKVNAGDSRSFLNGLPYDFSRIGVIGHSLGGAAIVNAAAIDPRIGAIMVLDGWYIPVPDTVISQGVDQPIFHLGQKEWGDPINYQRMDRLLANSSGAIFKLLIPGTQHTDYTDMPLFTPFSLYIGYTATRDPIRLNSLIRRSTVYFFDTYLKGQDPTGLTVVIKAEKNADSYVYIPTSP